MNHITFTVMDFQRRKLLSISKEYGRRRIKLVLKTQYLNLCFGLDVRFSLRKFCLMGPLFHSLKHKMSSKWPSSKLLLNKRLATL